MYDNYARGVLRCHLLLGGTYFIVCFHKHLLRKKEYVYIILKYNNSFYLQKKSDKEIITYQNEIIKFGHNDYFHDDVVKQHILKNNLDIISYKYIGKAIKCEKKDNIYLFTFLLSKLFMYLLFY